MRKSFTLVFILFYGISAFGQRKVESKLGELREVKLNHGIVEYAGTEPSDIRVPPPRAFYNMENGKTSANSTFEVTYVNFSPEAQAAFQQAVNIWQSLLQSDVTIHIEAHWDPLDANTLGSAFPSTAYGGGFGPKANVWYPIALAEKLTRRDLNDPAEPDIIAQFNSGTNWYLGLDGNPGPSQFDLVTVVLHEICHGLGFFDFSNVDANTGNGTYEFSGYPFVYTAFLENGGGNNIIENYLDGTPALATQWQSGDIYFNAFLSKLDYGQRVPIYAPDPYEDGSSISHLDPDKLLHNTDGLMRPGISPGLSIQDPGVALHMLQDLGWLQTFFDFTPIANSEDFNSPVPTSININSDSDIDSSSVKIIWSHFNTGTTTPWDVPSAIDTLGMVSAGKGKFTATLPTYNEQTLYSYYFVVNDEFGRTITYPTEAPGIYYFQFAVATDNSPPTLAHDPVLYVDLGTTTVPLEATAYDFIGIKSLVVDYTIGGVTQTPFELIPDVDNDTHFTGSITLDANLAANTEIQYKLTATDNAAAANQTVLPATGFYTFKVEAPFETQTSYVNDFTSPTTDFLGDLFTESTVSGFSNQAFHSPHPYLEGPTGGAKNYVSVLRYPILLDNDSAFIQFDEIVLVEPGEDGSVFGDSDFWDYVIVEGSKDGGTTWIPFLNGYDCRAKSDWESTYRSGLSNNDYDSHVDGTPSLFHPRKINMLANGFFSAGETVQIRFRLYSDELAKGWGWAIDNLRVQSLITGLDDLLDESTLQIYPNPTFGLITINASFREPVRNGVVRVMNLMGKTILSKPIDSAGTSLNEQLDMSTSPDGIYLISIETPQGKVVRKIIKAN